MLAIRLARGGAKKAPFYQLVVTDSRNARDSGAVKERLGRFNPVARQKEAAMRINLERVDYWLSVGAQPSTKAAQLIAIVRRANTKGIEPVMRTKVKVQKTEPTAEASTDADTSPAEDTQDKA